MTNISAGAVVWKLDVDDAEFEKGLRKAKKDIDGFGDAAESTSRRASGGFDKVAKSIVSLGAGVAAIHAAIQSVTSFGAFEQNVNVLGEVTSATDAQLRQLSSTAIQLGKDTSLPGVSAADAAAAMLELGKAGLKVSDVMGAAKGTLQAAKAGNIGVAESAKIVAQALNAFSLEGKEATKVADILAGAANASAFDIDQIGLALSQSSQAAKTAGVSLADTVTAISALGNAGLQASDAGTSLKTFFNNLTPDSKPAREAMKQLGITFFDAKGNFVGLRETSERLQNAFAGLTQEQRLATAEAIFGSDAQRAALVLAEQGAEGFDKLSASVNKAGAAQKLAAAQTKGITGAIGALSSSLETAAIEFGNLIAPVVEPALRGIADALNVFIEGLKNGNPLIQAAAIFLGVLATGLLIVATAFGVATLAGGLFAAIFSPISLIIIGVIAVIAALAAIAFVVVQNWSTISQFFAGLWNGILAGVSGFIAGVAQFFRELPGKIVSALGSLGSLLLGAGKSLIDGLVKGLGDAKDAVINKIKEICNNSLSEIKKFFGISSPSRVMAEQGRFIAEGLAEGIGQGQGMVDAAIHRLDPQLSPTADLLPQISPDITSPGTAARSGTGGQPIEVTQNIYNNVDMDRGLRDLAWRLAN